MSVVSVLIGIGAGGLTALALLFVYTILSLLGRARVDNAELQKQNAAYLENARKQSEMIRKLAEENAANRPYSIHFSDEQIFNLAHMITTHMETLHGPKN